MEGLLMAVGGIALMLSVTIVILLPLCLAIWVSSVWLWLYAFYAVFTVVVGYLAIRYSEKHNIGGN